MYNQFDFSDIESCMLEKKHDTNASHEQNLSVYIFNGPIDFKKHKFKNISLFLINTFDEKVLEIISKISFFLCIIIVLVIMINFLNTEAADWFYILGMMLSLVPLIISLFIQNVLEYHRDTFCKECGKKLACEEVGEPIMKETSNFGDYTLTVTRRWRCRYCGGVDIREGPENIFAEKGEMLPVIYLKGIECKKCSGLGAVVEFKKPDIKEIGNKRMTRRYYNCTLCGHNDISESEEVINQGAMSANNDEPI